MLILTTLALGGCLIPPDRELMVDGGVNRAPSINTSLSVPKPGGVFDYWQLAKPKEFSVVLKDLDKQALSLRFFLERKYETKLPLDKNATTGGGTSQPIVVKIAGLCDELVDSLEGTYFLEIYVSDSGFLDSGDDLRQVKPGGLSTNANWTLKCNTASTADGGLN
jgi:hypothetical protein